MYEEPSPPSRHTSSGSGVDLCASLSRWRAQIDIAQSDAPLLSPIARLQFQRNRHSPRQTTIHTRRSSRRHDGPLRPPHSRHPKTNPLPAISRHASCAAAAKEVTAIRTRFQIAESQFSILLLGEDSAITFRSTTPVTISRLNSLIDEMLDRKLEMQRPHSN
jgi:Domain of unknown function (DUF4174)